MTSSASISSHAPGDGTYTSVCLVESISIAVRPGAGRTASLGTVERIGDCGLTLARNRTASARIDFVRVVQVVVDSLDDVFPQSAPQTLVEYAYWRNTDLSARRPLS